MPENINWDYWGVFLALVGFGLTVAYALPAKHPYFASFFYAVAALQLITGLLSRSWPPAVKYTIILFLIFAISYGDLKWVHSVNSEQASIAANREKSKIDALAPRIPKIVIIQGKGGFGELHRQAVKYALQPIVPTKAYCLDCEESIADIKLGRPDPCMKQLHEWLENQDVLAVVGPSATEATRLVIENVNNSGYKVPLFISSAAPRSELQWPGLAIPVFRISSGIDERATELAKLTRRLVDSAVHVLFLVEHNRNTNVPTYGERLEESIRDLDYKYWEGRLADGTVSRIEYQTGEINSKCDLLLTETQRKQVIFVLGIGDDFRTIVDRCYSAKTSRAKLLGFMNAYAITPTIKSSLRPMANIFEITDLELDPNKRRADVKHFEDKFGQLTPAVRDQAYSYDVGTILLKAFEDYDDQLAARPALKYSEALAIIASSIQHTNFLGLTGQIKFDPSKTNYYSENILTRLTLTHYDIRKKQWMPVDSSVLLKFDR